MPAVAVPKQPLTARQREVLDFIRDYGSQRGYPPTIREIGDRLGGINTNAVAGHLRHLERKGAIEVTPGASRGIKIMEHPAKRQRPGLCPHCGGIVG